MRGPPPPRPVHVLRPLVVLPVLRPGKPASPAPECARLLTLRLPAVSLVGQMSRIRSVQLAAVPALTLSRSFPLGCLHPSMIPTRTTAAEENRTLRRRRRRREENDLNEVLRRTRRTRRTPISSWKLYPAFRTAAAAGGCFWTNWTTICFWRKWQRCAVERGGDSMVLC